MEAVGCGRRITLLAATSCVERGRLIHAAGRRWRPEGGRWSSSRRCCCCSMAAVIPRAWWWWRGRPRVRAPERGRWGHRSVMPCAGLQPRPRHQLLLTPRASRLHPISLRLLVPHGFRWRLIMISSMGHRRACTSPYMRPSIDSPHVVILPRISITYGKYDHLLNANSNVLSLSTNLSFQPGWVHMYLMNRTRG